MRNEVETTLPKEIKKQGFMRTKPLLVAFLFGMILAFSAIYPANSQPAQGDWVVTTSEVVENKSIVLNGNLVVKGGGSLTLRNVTLTINNQFRGQYGITVEPGSSLIIYNSKITPSDLKNRITFVVRGSFAMKDSELRGVGWGDDFFGSIKKLRLKELELGLTVESDDALIEGNLISESAVGVILTGSRATVRGNTFRSNDFGAVWVFSSHNNVIGNSIQHFGTTSEARIIWILGQGNAVIGNTFSQESTTPPTRDQSVICLGTHDFEHNTDNNLVVNNTISSLLPSAWVFPIWAEGGSNNIIENNSFIRTGGIFVWHGVNYRIKRNTIHSVGFGGIWLARVYNTIVDNNKISGEEVGGVPHPSAIALDHSSNNFILNNDIEGDFGISSVLLFDSRNNTILGNRISISRFQVKWWRVLRYHGLFLYSNSNGNIISNNEIRVGPDERIGKLEPGVLPLVASSITIDASSSNLIYQNNFIDQRGAPYDSGNNNWHHEGRGNYWSRYTGTDRDRDGIGDTPYHILPNGVDSHPLINPVVVKPSPVPEVKPTPSAVPPTFPAKELTKMMNGKAVGVEVVENEIMEVEAGYNPTGLTVRNSTLILGRKGPVLIRAPVTIENSVLIAAENGFGFVITSTGDASIVIRNSEIRGAGWFDWGIGAAPPLSMGENLIIENSIIMDTNVIWSHGLGFRSIRIVNNTFSGLHHGVGVHGSRGDVLISGNMVYRSLWGAFSVYEGRNVTVENNVILRCWGWMTIEIKPSALVVGNTISNSAVGLVFNDGHGSTIYHNNFINNAIHARGPENIRWDYNGEGNYWDDYAGKDANLDGIGDEPYVNPHGVRDSFPFMRKNGWLTKFWLTVKTNFPSIPFKVNGTEYKTGSEGSIYLRLGYIANYEVSFAQDVLVSEGSRLRFLKWEDGATNSVRIMSLNSNSTLQASYVKQYLLKVVSEFGEITGSGWYDEGVQASFSVKDARVTISPQLTKVFKGWTGDVTESTPSASIKMDGPKTILAMWSDELTTTTPTAPITRPTEERRAEVETLSVLSPFIIAAGGAALATLIIAMLLRRRHR